MKQKKIFRVILILALLIAVSLCGTVFAYMFRQTEVTENNFTPAEVSCEVVEVTNNPTTEKTSVKIQNTGNIDAYLRVRFVSYWVNDKGEVAPMASKILDEITIRSGWIQGSDQTYYYSEAVAAGELTPELLAGPIALNAEDGYTQVIEVFAEAIQSQPTNAVVNSWKVTLDSDGNITAAQ